MSCQHVNLIVYPDIFEGESHTSYECKDCGAYSDGEWWYVYQPKEGKPGVVRQAERFVT